MRKDLAQPENLFEIPEISNSQVAVFVNRLIGVFEILMAKLELAAALPHISSNDKICNRADSKKIASFFSQFTSHGREFPAASHSQDEASAIETDNSNSAEPTDDATSTLSPNESSCSCGSLEDRAHVHELIQVMLSNPTVRQFSKKLKSEMTKSNNFLRQIKYFMEFVIFKLLLMPIEEREKEVTLRELCSQIDDSKKEISSIHRQLPTNLCMTVSLEEQKSRQRHEAQQLTDKLDDLLDQWQRIDQEYNASLGRLLNESKENKAKCFQDFTERMSNHQSLFEKLKGQLENDKANNKKIEQKIQTQKFKVESQLISLITKFDTEIGDRQEIYENLVKEYDDLQQEKSQLMDDMNEQFIVYNGIIREREEKAFEEYRERYEKFVKNRSAKIIQRWWRKLRLKLKKKNKKKVRTTATLAALVINVILSKFQGKKRKAK